jgi:protein TonB
LPLVASLAVHVALAAGATMVPGMSARPLDAYPVELVVLEPPRAVREPSPTAPTLIAAPPRSAPATPPARQPRPSENAQRVRPPAPPEPVRRELPAPPSVPPPVTATPPPAPQTSPQVAAVPAEAPASAGPGVAQSSRTPPPAIGSAATSADDAPASSASALPASARSSVASLPPDAGVTRWARPTGGYQVRPAYPSSAKRLGIQGTALLRVHVLADGRVGEVAVEHSAGHRDLDEAAVDAVRRWRFEPARRGDDAVAMWVRLPVEFKLR